MNALTLSKAAVSSCGKVRSFTIILPSPMNQDIDYYHRSSSIPKEVFIHYIFENIETKLLLISCSTVCKEWNLFVDQSVRRIIKANDKLTDEILIRFINLTSLHLRSNRTITDNGSSITSNNTLDNSISMTYPVTGTTRNIIDLP